ncbi:VOC family protein [Virgibacillus salexigens]|uniref:Glyoxalase n=1 Tax=Virgibacillus kapii TaxID=1638645 RepID=A0ABQ2DTA9_9BACI|nr:VOC family protein [Virgibacillus kapii]GGJ70501.1 glyoxalase [Virgibacillus kapii]
MSFQLECFDHIQLAAPCNGEEQAIAFYQGILGMELIDKPEPLRKNGGVWFQARSLQIHVGIEDPFKPSRKAHPAIRVQHLQELKNRFVLSQINVIEDQLLPGANRFYVVDPFGNRLEFLEWKI